MTKLLFAYGSLRRGQDNPHAQRLASGSTLVGPAYVNGHLVEVQGFPALVDGKAGSGRVEGELLAIGDDLLWAQLDAYENAGEPGWYDRKLVVAIDAKGQPRSAWAYVAKPA